MEGQVSYGRQLSLLAGRFEDETAVVHVSPEGEERLVSWAELERRANQVARLLAAQGVGQDDIVAVALPNSGAHFFSSFGAWKLGATVLPMRWDLPAWERDRLLGLARPAAVVAEWDDGPANLVTLADLDASRSLEADPLPDRVADPARAIATSGSTGSPKLIVTPGSGIVNADPTADATKELGLRDRATQLVMSPLYHTNGFACINGLMNGQTLVVMERFDAALAVDLIERWKVNTTIAVPTMLQRIAQLPDVRSRDFSSIDSVLYGGAPVAPWVVRVWFDLIPPEKLWFAYGGTESLGLAMAHGGEWLEHEGTAGRPVGCEVRILGPGGEELPTGEIGEIFMRRLDGSKTFDYIGATARTTEDGFGTFGDLGRVDEDGYLYVADRRVDMVVSGGANVYPAEVELLLTEHPGVGDVVVVGLPDEEWGQRVHAVIEPADPAHAPTEDDLRAFCRERLAAYKVPKSFEFVERVPRTAAGKVNRSAIVAERTGAASS
ncbi:MAG TPA: AMP-binding protein [Acidimicrobiales bacterium]|nr:AMP-binding protein [Acidimicrobiales bacterium]